jgi:hypothetical protein
MKLIFSIESDWEGSAKKQSSILPMLQCISGIYPSIKHIFRTANTKDELSYCLGKFKQVSRTNGDFCAVFFSGHGSPGQVFLGQKPLTLQELAEVASEVEEKLFDGCLVHFDACSVVKDSEETVKDFMKSTGAALVTGFACDMDFIESFALEMIFIDYLSEYKQPYRAFNKLIKNHSELCKRTELMPFRN